MAAPLDEGVGNLEAFIGVVIETTEKVGEATPDLEAQGRALADLEGEAGDELGGFDRELDSGLQETDALADATKAALEKLEATARGGADGVLDGMTEAFEEWEDTLGGTLDEAAETVRDGAAELASDGFEPVEEALESARGDLQESRTTVESAFEALQAKLDQERQRFGGTLVKASLDAEQAAEAADALESDFETRSDARLEELKGDSTTARAAHAATKDEASSFYDGIEGRAQSEAQELMEAVGQAFEQAAQAMREEAEVPLREPADTVINEALEPFSTEVQAWEQLEQSAEQSLARFETLVGELESSEQVVDVIAEINREVG